MARRADYIKEGPKDTKIKITSKKSDKIICPHCGENIFVNPGKLLGKKSGQARIGQSVMMRELVELRWNKIKNNKLKISKSKS